MKKIWLIVEKEIHHPWNGGDGSLRYYVDFRNTAGYENYQDAKRNYDRLSKDKYALIEIFCKE